MAYVSKSFLPVHPVNLFREIETTVVQVICVGLSNSGGCWVILAEGFALSDVRSALEAKIQRLRTIGFPVRLATV